MHMAQPLPLKLASGSPSPEQGASLITRGCSWSWPPSESRHCLLNLTPASPARLDPSLPLLRTTPLRGPPREQPSNLRSMRESKLPARL